MIAATGSGCGKTTITCAAIAAFQNQGLRVCAFKCGPDFIDPIFHREILGATSRNLDLVMADEKTTRSLFLQNLKGDVAVVEGAMGLYDGADFGSNDGSPYHVACALDIPIALVVNARGMGRSTLALVKGFVDLDRERRIVGVILNRISESTFLRLKPILEAELDVRVLGYFPNQPDLGLESRYLGLKLPHEVSDLRARVQKASEDLARTIDLNATLALAREFPESASPPEVRTPLRARIAVARDDAFCFYYEENLRMLREAGAELVFFSPLANEPVPADVDGLLLSGGYPELHAERLSANRTTLDSVKTLYASGAPTMAESGGFIYLHESLVTRDGTKYPLVGAIPGICRDVGKLVRFGYVKLTEKKPAFLDASAGSVMGHEFHYFDSDNNGEDCEAVKPASGKRWFACHTDARRLLGFPHLYYPSNPAAPRAFVDKCAHWRETRSNG